MSIEQLLENPAWIGSMTGLAVTAGATVAWFTRKFRGVTRTWLHDEVVSLLRNDDTPVAVYAHQTRDQVSALSDKVSGIADKFADMHDDLRDVSSDIRDTNKLILKHVENHDRHQPRTA